MLTAITTVFVTFALTGLIGNWILQRWQYRNWLNQQQVSGEEKEYLELKKLWDEIAVASGKRLSCMRRLASVLRSSDDELVRQRLKDYDAVLAEWNAALNSHMVRLTLYANWNIAWSLEQSVQKQFVRVGQLLEAATNKRLQNQPLQPGARSALEDELNRLDRQLFKFNRSVLAAVQKQRERTYYGAKVEFRSDSISKFGTWELFKVLFKPVVPPYRVVRTPAELGFPREGGP